MASSQWSTDDTAFSWYSPTFFFFWLYHNSQARKQNKKIHQDNEGNYRLFIHLLFQANCCITVSPLWHPFLWGHWHNLTHSLKGNRLPSSREQTYLSALTCWQWFGNVRTSVYSLHTTVGWKIHQAELVSWGKAWNWTLISTPTRGSSDRRGWGLCVSVRGERRQPVFQPVFTFQRETSVGEFPSLNPAS